MAELSHTSTSSSSSSGAPSAHLSSSSTSVSSLGNKFRQSFGLDPIVPHAPHTHTHRHHRVNLNRIPKNPEELVEMAIEALFTIPGPTMEVLRGEILPRFFHAGSADPLLFVALELTLSFRYVHRVNAREMSLDKLLALVVLLRTRFATLRVRFKSSLIDGDGSCSLENPAGCAVGVAYDIIALPIKSTHASGSTTKSKEKKEKDGNGAHHEEVRGSAMEIVKIYQGRIAQGDLVLDTKELQMSNQPTELSCLIM